MKNIKIETINNLFNRHSEQHFFAPERFPKLRSIQHVSTDYEPLHPSSDSCYRAPLDRRKLHESTDKVVNRSGLNSSISSVSTTRRSLSRLCSRSPEIRSGFNQEKSTNKSEWRCIASGASGRSLQSIHLIFVSIRYRPYFVRVRFRCNLVGGRSRAFSMGFHASFVRS